MRRTNRGPRRWRPELGGAALEERSLLSTFTVTNLNDAGAGSLRRAVDLSNLNPGADLIRFAPGLTGEIHLTSGQLDVTDDVAILGPGANRIAVSGNTSRIFEVHDVNATLNGLTLENGSAVLGGAILQEGGRVSVDQDTFSGNQALSGGALDNFHGDLSVTNDTFTANTAVGFGGALGYGGALLNVGRLSVSDSTFTANTAVARGGAIENTTFLDGLTTAATISNSRFTGNSADAGGAVADQTNANVTLVGDQFLANRATTNGGAFFNGDGPGESGVANVSRSTFLSNAAGSEGGGVFSQDNLTLASSTLQFNTATTGGAVWALNGTFTPIANTIQFNSAPEVFLA